MTIQPDLLSAVVIIVLAAFFLLLVVAVLAPAALGVLVKPLLDVIARLIELLARDKPPPEPPAETKK